MQRAPHRIKTIVTLFSIVFFLTFVPINAAYVCDGGGLFSLPVCKNIVAYNITNNFTTNYTTNITNNISTNYTYNISTNYTENITNNITNNISTLTTSVSSYINNGMVDPFNSSDPFVVEGYYRSPWLSIGQNRNLLLQTEAFATTWLRINSSSAILSDAEFSPIGTLTADILRYSSSASRTGYLEQNVTASTLENYTFSIWMKTIQGNYTNATIGLQIISNNQNSTITYFNVTNIWTTYNITFLFNLAHTNVGVRIWNNQHNVTLWGAQLENISKLTPYSGALTTSARTTLTRELFTPINIRTTGSITAAGVAVGGTLSGATTGAFSGTITQTTATGFIPTTGMALVSTTAATSAVPYQMSPRILFTGLGWDTGASRQFSFKEEIVPLPHSLPVRALLRWGYTYITTDEQNYSTLMTLSSVGNLTVLGVSNSTEVLSNGGLLSGTNWLAYNGFALTGNTAHMNFSRSASGKLTQTATSLTVLPNRWYKLEYWSDIIVAGCLAYIGEDTADAKYYLRGASTIGQYKEYFHTSPTVTNFTITANCTAGSFRWDNLSLQEVNSGDIVASGQFTGGGTNGIRINGLGNITISSLTGTGNTYLCVNSTGGLYRNLTCV